MQPISRRAALQKLSVGSACLAFGIPKIEAAVGPGKQTRLGIVTYALGLNERNQWQGRHPGACPALAFLEECHRLGAGGVQLSISAKDRPFVSQLRSAADNHGMFIEAIINPPADETDLDRFATDIKAAKESGATLARTVLFPGRRYEQFHALADFQAAEKKARQMLEWAEPVLARNKFYLAVENHKDQRTDVRLSLLKKLSSHYIGACVDVGNSIALLENPMETVRAFAPWAFTVHIKDHAVAESEDGFWLADMAMGEGFLDLAGMIKILRESRPDIHFNLETITRDPLKIPVLRNEYWATLMDVPARDLAQTLELVKKHQSKQKLARVTVLAPEEQLAMELGNVQKSLKYAAERLET